MSLSFISIDYYRKKFYQKENSSKRFIELSEERLSEIKKNVQKNKDAMTDTGSQRLEKTSKYDAYEKTMQHLTNPYIHLDLKTFDERVAYLIMMSDPDLVIFREFLKLDLMSYDEISKVADEEEREQLRQRRKKMISKYEAIVREKIGFFDPKLLKYEDMFFKKFLNEKELITDVGTNNQSSLIIRAKLLKDFNSISDERYQELLDIAQTWLSLVPDKCNSKVATYSVINQKKLLGLNSVAEQLALFILLVDSDLDMLRIYEEESMMENISRRIIEQFGYFDQELLILEKKFHNRFCPEKVLSVWTKIKKALDD